MAWIIGVLNHFCHWDVCQGLGENKQLLSYNVQPSTYQEVRANPTFHVFFYTAAYLSMSKSDETLG